MSRSLGKGWDVSEESRARGAANSVRAREGRKRPDPLPSQRSDPATCHPEYTEAETEYLRALVAERQRIAPRFLTEADRLHLLMRLGYRKVEGAIP